MESITKEVIEVLKYLLPGFVSSWIFNSLTSRPSPTQFYSVVQALIFTFLIEVTVKLLEKLFSLIGCMFAVGLWNADVALIWASITSIFFGFTFSYFANNDKFHDVLRKLNITKETSYPSEWFGAFNQYVRYVVLHLRDERRLYGYPMDWPSTPQSGHFLLTHAYWIVKNKPKAITGVQFILIDVKDVLWVEFMNEDAIG